MSDEEKAELRREIESLQSQIAALREKIAHAEKEIECLEIRTDGHSRSLDKNADIREINGRTIDRLLNMVDGHSERIKAIEAHLWPDIARDHKAVRHIIGPPGKPGAGEKFDKRE